MFKLHLMMPKYAELGSAIHSKLDAKLQHTMRQTAVRLLRTAAFSPAAVSPTTFLGRRHCH
jgi:hypothetical protein